ncbi:helicase-primase primase subunit [Aotine betaherpesvirus 1]|uniref:Helicase-primase primase subunit n=1 Tax=Aotine betaherpesvirus 1 TaxID=50290 RepID=G8XUD5_9BETA|nr:helicase-primase primase subunit [Aotine betaherpesvirus 1]AEV80765.1 helicase-primase primase subunit [Aotine betaherpesvirus 1]
MTLVLFATEYDAANIVTNILLKAASNHHIYPLIVKHKASRLIHFCLQTQKCHNSERIAPVFVCHTDRLDLMAHLNSRTPITTSKLIESLDEDETRLIYQHLFRTVTAPALGGEVREFKHLVYFHHTAVLRFLNQTFLAPTSPSWFISVFGHTEGLLVLTMSYYLFERQYSTIPTVEEYVRSFTPNTGQVIPTHTSMSEFMNLMLGSRFKIVVPQFVNYAIRRNQRDYVELTHVDTQINTFRDRARLPDAICVHYIYLAYRTALCKKRLLQYRKIVAYDPEAAEQCQTEPLFLGRHLVDDLLDVMNRYFSLHNFLSEYVEVQTMDTGTHPLRLSGYDIDTDGDSLIRFCGNMSTVVRTIERINSLTDSVFSPTERSLGGMLRICASTKPARRYVTPDEVEHTYQKQYLFPPQSRCDGPVPLYRVHLPGNKHLFCAVLQEAWSRTLFPGDFLRHIPDNCQLSDEALTDALWMHDDGIGDMRPDVQFYYTRHEIFNERLPVFNFVGDFDLRLRDGVTQLTKTDIFDLCRGLRRVFVTVWKTLFPEVEESCYPVYFFKSACRHLAHDVEPMMLMMEEHEDDPSPGSSQAYCHCTEKIGMRIITPFPPGTVVVQPTVLRAIGQILNHAICLDPALHQHLDAISHPENSLDTGIYHHGRSVRLPYMYKMDDHGYLMQCRLLPLFVLPDAFRSTPLSFVRAQLDLRNLLHHCAPRFPQFLRRDDEADGSAAVRPGAKGAEVMEAETANSATAVSRVLVDVRDKLCPKPDSNFIDTRSLDVTRYRRRAFSEVLARHTGAGEATAETVRHLVHSCVWPPLLEHLVRHYPPEISEQFQQDEIAFDVSDLQCVGVKKQQGQRLRDFRCLNRVHRNPQETVQVFIDLKPDRGYALWAVLWSRCFTSKCHSNSKNVHVSVKIKAPATPEA